MGEIEKMNHTKVTEFIILGFVEFPEMQLLLFLVFLIVYLMSLTGNLLIIFTVCSDSHLHSPMFFFLINLSFLEICYVSVTVPKLLAVLIAQNKTISFMQCMIQMYLFLACTDAEIYLLTAMAYDRYVAICKPLHYTIIMNKKVCIILVLVSWITVVLLFYGTTIGVYLRPKPAYSMDLNKLVSVVYITAVPLLNPLIYSLRNKELKETLRKTTGGKVEK
ncbi:olfactory receptor 6C3-like, partial [Microcaecilia unicolor]|uniref:Olfactory receptor 6C3-like n=1 Tax=Microcaecilia unicolor TaxID=1415580 RepID=A0A6P7YTN9_9AMPH